MISDRFWLVIYGVCKACLFFLAMYITRREPK
jgi:hypothetical protein